LLSIVASPKRKTTQKRRDALCLEHLEWAHAIARHVATLLPTWFTADDLTGPVELALLRLASDYDARRGVPFRAFAQRRIYGACWDSVRRKEYRERGHQSTEGLDAVSPLADPEAQAAVGEQVQVWAQVQQLPSRHALVILAVYGGGMSLEHLATKVDVGSSRLSQIHHEALGMLRGMAA
jgi:RNA polymerase sigma factor (sigma-70 family)